MVQSLLQKQSIFSGCGLTLQAAEAPSTKESSCLVVLALACHKRGQQFRCMGAWLVNMQIQAQVPFSRTAPE